MIVPRDLHAFRGDDYGGLLETLEEGRNQEKRTSATGFTTEAIIHINSCFDYLESHGGTIQSFVSRLFGRCFGLRASGKLALGVAFVRCRKPHSASPGLPGSFDSM